MKQNKKIKKIVGLQVLDLRKLPKILPTADIIPNITPATIPKVKVPPMDMRKNDEGSWAVFVILVMNAANRMKIMPPTNPTKIPLIATDSVLPCVK